MSKRKFKLRKHQSKRMFAKHGNKNHVKNMPMPRRVPMRGGIRM